MFNSMLVKIWNWFGARYSTHRWSIQAELTCATNNTNSPYTVHQFANDGFLFFSHTENETTTTPKENEFFECVCIIMLITITCSLRSVNSSNIVSNFINFQTRWNAAITFFFGAANAMTITTTMTMTMMTTLTKKMANHFMMRLLLFCSLVCCCLCWSSIVSSIVPITLTRSHHFFSGLCSFHHSLPRTTITTKKYQPKNNKKPDRMRRQFYACIRECVCVSAPERESSLN